jgi:hypothetical protein
MFTKRVLMSSNTDINLKIIRFRSIYQRGNFYFSHLVVSWLKYIYIEFLMPPIRNAWKARGTTLIHQPTAFTSQKDSYRYASR